MKLKDKNLYYIGGVVRDEFLGKESFDIDLTYDGNAIEFAKKIPDSEIIQINEPFGTVKIKIDGNETDIASTRSETYPQKGHLPVVSNIGCSLKEDVLRRDFTINALAKSTLTGKVIDYVGGLKDLENKTIRILHDESFIDDPTRILRALKFSVRFDFKLDKHTKKLQQNYLKNINYDMSYKRLKKELIETFNLNSQKAFEIFVKDGIYKLVSPKDFKLPKLNIEKIINKYKPKNVWIIYVGLLPDISNLPLTKTEKNIVEKYNEIKEKTFHDDFDIYKTFENIPLESILMYAVIDKKITEKYLTKLKTIKLSITGKDLNDLGFKPSEKYQKCFDYILKKKLIKTDMKKSEEINLAKEWFTLT